MTVAVLPRSTRTHWSSVAAEDQRVPVSPSTALAAAVPLFSSDDAVADFPWDKGVSAAVADGWVAGRASSAAVAASAVPRDLSLIRRLQTCGGSTGATHGLVHVLI